MLKRKAGFLMQKGHEGQEMWIFYVCLMAESSFNSIDPTVQLFYAGYCWSHDKEAYISRGLEEVPSCCNHLPYTYCINSLWRWWGLMVGNLTSVIDWFKSLIQICSTKNMFIHQVLNPTSHISLIRGLQPRPLSLWSSEPLLDFWF